MKRTQKDVYPTEESKLFVSPPAEKEGLL